MQKISYGKDVIFCSGRSGSTLLRSRADEVVDIDHSRIERFTKGFHSNNFNYHLLMRHPVERYLSGMFFEWHSKTFFTLDNTEKNYLINNPFLPLNSFFNDVRNKKIALDPFHVGNWLSSFNYSLHKRCRIWKFEDIDKLANYVNINPVITNANDFCIFSYRDIYSKLDYDLKVYVRDYLKKEIATYYIILKSNYNSELIYD